MEFGPIEAKPKLRAFGDQAFRDLTQGVSLGYNNGRVTVQAPIMYKAGLGPATIQVQAENPTTLKGTVKPGTISAITTMGLRKYKYTADIQFDVTVTMHPTTKKTPELVKKTVPKKTPAIVPRSNTGGNLSNTAAEFFTVVTLLILSVVSWQTRVALSVGQTTSIGPFMHTIPMEQPGTI